MMTLGLLLPVLVIGAVAYAAGWRPNFGNLGQASGDHAANRALDILRERYARGEISADEYQRMRSDVEK